MAEDPREKSAKPPSAAQRLLSARDVVWSWLTDPAVLVYGRAVHGKTRPRVLIVEFFLFLREVTTEFWYIQGTARAASLAYTTLLSLVPLLVAFNWLIQRYLASIFPDFRSQIDSVLNAIIPYQSPQLTYHIARFTENAQTASAIGLVAFLFIAFRLFVAVEGAVNEIWKVRSSHGYRQKIIAFTMLFFWGPLLMTLSFTSTAALERNRFLRVLFQGDFIFIAFPIFILFIAFTMLFWLVPSTRVRLSAAAVGAVVTTALFSMVRFGFGIYAAYLFAGRFNVIYGTVGLAIIFLISIEVMWLVILLGVEISFVYQNLYGVLRATEQQIDDQPRFDLYFAMRAMLEIARRFDTREDPPSSYRLAEQFGTTDAQMLRVLQKLESASLVKATGGEWIGWLPGCDPDRISIEEIVAQIEGSLRVLPEVGPVDEERAAVGELFRRLNESTAAALNQTTVGLLVRNLYSPRAPSRIEDRFGTRRDP